VILRVQDCFYGDLTNGSLCHLILELSNGPIAKGGILGRENNWVSLIFLLSPIKHRAYD
jgi:hypothetical protein